MQIKINITKDEAKWLDEVIHYGGEVTKFMQKEGFLSSKKDWDKIQYKLYGRRPISQ